VLRGWRGGGRSTKLSPFSFVMFAGKPAGSACWNISICPVRAASKRRLARARAAGGSVDASGFEVEGSDVFGPGAEAGGAEVEGGG